MSTNLDVQVPEDRSPRERTLDHGTTISGEIMTAEIMTQEVMIDRIVEDSTHGLSPHPANTNINRTWNGDKSLEKTGEAFVSISLS